MQMDRNKMNFFLKEKLNTYSGVVLENIVDDPMRYYQKAIDIRWRGDVHFVFYYNSNGRGYYEVERDSQRISALYWVQNFKEKDIQSMQHLIHDIESGRYRKKKTLKDSIRDQVEKCGLTSYMNATKWQELIGELEQYPDLTFMYKTIFDTEIPVYYWDIGGDEDIAYMNRAVIEWMKINPRIIQMEYIGRLVKPNITETDLSPEVESFLKKHSIPYEYDESERIYTVYGWK